MTNPEMKTLLDSMKAAIDLETEKVTQEMIIKRYNAKMAEIEPQLMTREMPEEPVEPYYESCLIKDIYDQKSNLPIVIVNVVLGGLFFIGLYLLGLSREGDQPNAASGGLVLMGFSLLMLIAFYLPYFIMKRKREKRNEELHAIYESEHEKYAEKLLCVKKENERITIRYNHDQTEWKKKHNEDIAVLSKHLAETNALLKQLYDTGFIYSKYRNLPALTSIYEYFITGRCESLTGAHGAYNMYEDEVRKDTVISQLNLVIQNLEQIKQNQYMLYQQVSLMNDSLSAVSRDISMIKLNSESIMQFSAINAYYAGLTAAHTRISATMHLLNG